MTQEVVSKVGHNGSMTARLYQLDDIARKLSSSADSISSFLTVNWCSNLPQYFDRSAKSAIISAYKSYRESEKRIRLDQVAMACNSSVNEVSEVARRFGAIGARFDGSVIDVETSKSILEVFLPVEDLKKVLQDWPPPPSYLSLANLVVIHGVATVLESNSVTWTQSTTGEHAESVSREVNSLVRLIRIEAAERPLRIGPFLMRLIERIQGDSYLSKLISSEGLSLDSLETSLTICSNLLPALPSGPALEKEIRWALKRLPRSSGVGMWLANQGGQNARLVNRNIVPIQSNKPKRVISKSEIEVGQLRWIQMEESRGGRRSTLHHPALIMESSSANKWVVVSLTSSLEGEPRSRRVPRPSEQGLEKDGFVWHESTKVYLSQIGSFIGWAHPELVDVVARTIRIKAQTVKILHTIALIHHVS